MCLCCFSLSTLAGLARDMEQENEEQDNAWLQIEKAERKKEIHWMNEYKIQDYWLSYRRQGIVQDICKKRYMVCRVKVVKIPYLCHSYEKAFPGNSYDEPNILPQKKEQDGKDPLWPATEFRTFKWSKFEPFQWLSLCKIA